MVSSDEFRNTLATKVDVNKLFRRAREREREVRANNRVKGKGRKKRKGKPLSNVDDGETKKLASYSYSFRSSRSRLIFFGKGSTTLTYTV
jgi:hypothetical protein